MPKNDIDSTARSLRQVRSIGAQFQTRAAKDGEGPVIEGYADMFAYSLVLIGLASLIFTVTRHKK